MKKYKVTFMQFGTAYIEALNAEDAKAKALELERDQIKWDQDQIPILVPYAECEEE